MLALRGKCGLLILLCLGQFANELPVGSKFTQWLTHLWHEASCVLAHSTNLRAHTFAHSYFHSHAARENGGKKLKVCGRNGDQSMEETCERMITQSLYMQLDGRKPDGSEAKLKKMFKTNPWKNTVLRKGTRRSCPLCNLFGFQKLCLPRDAWMTIRNTHSDTLCQKHTVSRAAAISCYIRAVTQQRSQSAALVGGEHRYSRTSSARNMPSWPHLPAALLPPLFSSSSSSPPLPSTH